MDQTNLANQSNQAPLALRVITSLGLIGAVIGAWASAGGALLFNFGYGLSLLAIIIFVKNVFLFVVLVALRKMKKWAFYVFVVLTIIDILLLISSRTSATIVEGVVYVVFLAYLFSLRKKFV